MRDVSLWRALLGVEKTVIELVEFDQGAELLVAHVRPTKIRLITRMAFGFKSPEALMALALLSLGGHRPALPARN